MKNCSGHFFFGSLVAVVVSVTCAFSQSTSPYERPIAAPVFLVASQDTFPKINEDSLVAASLSPVDTTIREGKSTTIAMLSSMVVPGFGQIYNESYWKAPLFMGLEYYFYTVYHNQDKLYKEYKTKYESAMTLYNSISATDTANVSKRSTALGNATDYKNYRDFYRDQRNNFGWYMVITYLLNVVDAYVDAALFNFEVSPNLQGTSDWRMRMSIPIN
jgi:hypothetical protein